MDLKRIVVAPDSFKGSLSAREVAESCKTGILMESPATDVVMVPLADGGEGTVASLSASFGGRRISVMVHGPLGSIVEATYLCNGDSAVMEMSQAAGLYLLSDSERNPMKTSTYGVGEMILDAINKGCRKIYMGIGGSATNDGGMGMLAALGYRFLDREGNDLEGKGEDLIKVADIDSSAVVEGLGKTEFVIACDVNNPFYGENGAAVVFGPQKGADPEMVRRLDDGMHNFAEVIRRKSGVDISGLAGAGAAGGLGGAFAAFLNARLQSGIEMILDAVDFNEKIKGADLIITGEGSIDRQSLMGKTLSGVLDRAKKEGTPVLVLAGKVEDVEALNRAGFTAIFPIENGAVTLSDAMERNHSVENIQRTVSQIVRLMMVKV